MAPRRRRSNPAAGDGLAGLGEDAATLGEDVAEAVADLFGVDEPRRPHRGTRRASARQLPRNLRRAADRPAGPRGRQAPQRLLDAAAAGILTRDNTAPGTAGRKAVYAVKEYRPRTARRPAGVSARAAAGHERSTQRPVITALVQYPDGSVQHVTLAGLGKRTRSRIGRHESLLRQLAEGRISPAAFRRRVAGWVPVGGLALASTPTAALAAEDERRSEGKTLGPYPDRAAA